MTFNYTILFVFLSFIVFMYAMKAIFFDPVLGIIKERDGKMLDDKNQATTLREQLVESEATYEQGLKDARKKSQDVISQIRGEALQKSAETVADARKKAGAELDKQMEELDRWREESYASLSSERANLTSIIINKVTEGKSLAKA